MIFNLITGTLCSFAVAACMQLSILAHTHSLPFSIYVPSHYSIDTSSHDGSNRRSGPTSQTLPAASALPAIGQIELRGEPEVPPKPHSTISTFFSRPTLIPRKETTLAPQILGYISTQGIYSSWNCHSGTYFSVSGYARCCPQANTDCPVYTACSATSILVNDQYNSTCTGKGEQTRCVTGTIYESEGDNNPRTFVGCWPSWTGGDWKATRTTPESSAATSMGQPPGTVAIKKASIAGIIVGYVAVGAVFFAAGIFAPVFYRKWRDRQQAQSSHSEGAEPAPASPPHQVLYQAPQGPHEVPDQAPQGPVLPQMAHRPSPRGSDHMGRTESFRQGSFGTSISPRRTQTKSVENVAELTDRNTQVFEAEASGSSLERVAQNIQQPQNARTARQEGNETMISIN